MPGPPQRHATRCLDEDEALDFVDGALGPARRDEAASHLERCAACRQLVSELAREGGPPEEGPAPGEAIGGRYVLGPVIGAGAMGVVYEAYDPELERKVALKLLKASDGPGEPGRQERLRREAQAMARVSHPNVVPVYDVGSWRGRVFVAMERVEGLPLSALLRAGVDWRRALGLFAQAGRGLGAAHRAGVVHRDFKPDNVLVDGEGRARVTDFGLARVERRSPADPGAAGGALMSSSFAGTPAYMAPEQLRGEAVDARTDQFGFCVALYEALYGRRPFDGGDAAALLGAMASGEFDRPARRRAPARLGRALERGLRFAPAERYPSMDALLDALERAARAKARPAALAGALLAAGGLAAAAGWALRARAPSCEGAGAQLAGVWGPARKDAVRRALLASGAPYAEGVFRSVERSLDRYAADWATMREDACLATHARREQSEELLRARNACLDQRRWELEALAEHLSAPSADAAEKAAEAGQSLPSLRECANAKAVLSPHAREGSEARRRTLAAVRVATVLGRFEGARGTALELVEQARRAGERLLEAQALEVLGNVHLEFGAVDESEQSHLDAYRLADALDADYVRVDSALSLAFLASCSRGEHRQGRRWVELGRSALERLGGDEALGAALAFMDGTVWACAAHFDEAVPALARAAEALERSPGHERAAAVASLNLAAALQYAGRFEDSLAAVERVERVTAATFGPRHPFGAEAAFSRAVVANALGRHRDARAQLEAAAAGFAAAFGDAHRQTLRARGALCLTGTYLGEADAAVACLRRLLEEAARSPDASRRMPGPSGDARDELGSLLGEALVAAGRPREALPLLERTRDELRASDREGVDHPYLGLVLTSLGRALLDLGRRDEAAAALERAGRTFGTYDPGPLDVGRQRFALARALAGADPARSRALAEDALARVRSAPGEGALRPAAEIEAWLGRRKGPAAGAQSRRR
ncbi:MAG TPA: serine/threonine-protein kinase [Polyangiaceae bacterium]|nr:serine/threonine-protein kinase [Polyangiaceae bacterium]